MPYARIWYEPAGVKVTTFVEGADAGHAIATLLASQVALYTDCTTEDVIRPLGAAL